MSAHEQMDARFAQYNTTFHATHAFVRKTKPTHGHNKLPRSFCRLRGRRRHEQKLQYTFASQNMEVADAVKDGVAIDADRRAYHLRPPNGPIAYQINHGYGYVFGPEAPSLGPNHVQETVLRCYETPAAWTVIVMSCRCLAKTHDLCRGSSHPVLLNCSKKRRQTQLRT